ncbi:MAG: SMP-30/gluconolactonase/LRE family protein [Acidimicrobiales bacterium]
MHQFTAAPCTTEAFYLGEGCRWDEVRAELSWVSVYDGRFLRARADGTSVEVVRRYDLGGHVTAVAPYAARADGWIVARDRALWHLSEVGELDRLGDVEAPEDAGVRTNDGAADPWGRFWIGTVAYDAAPGRGALYRFSVARGLERVVAGVTISNGLGWSPDRRTMYFVDSGPATLCAFDVDGAGEISARRVLARTDAAREGAPDGLCVDAEGAIWVAQWGGRCVRRYAPSGEVIARVEVDTPHPSCCAIGGANGTTLYVTTAQEDLSAEVRAREPLAGRLFSADVGVPGLPVNPFRPAPAT